MIAADPAGLKGVRKKDFFVRGPDDPGPEKASATFAYSPRNGKPEVHLTMPDGGEWFVDEDVLEWIVAAVKASRLHFAERSEVV